MSISFCYAQGVRLDDLIMSFPDYAFFQHLFILLHCMPRFQLWSTFATSLSCLLIVLFCLLQGARLDGVMHSASSRFCRVKWLAPAPWHFTSFLIISR